MRWLPVALGLLPLCWAAEAAAIPAFARKYTAPCALCHAPAHPALNAVGRRFLVNGYQLDPPGEATFREASSRRPDPQTRLSLLDQLPLALRAQSAAVLTPDPRNAGEGENALDLRPFEALFLLAGASIYPDVSFMASAALAPQPAIHHAALGFHNLLSPEGYLNLRLGRLLLLGFLRPEHRFLTGYPSPITSARVGLNPTTLEATQHGVEVFGRLLARRLFYHLAIVQGAQAADGVRDLDGYKDLFGELQVTAHHGLTLGVLGYLGRTQILDAARGLQVRFTDPFYMLGASAELDTAPLDLFGQALYVDHDDPFGDGEHANYWAFRLEAIAPLGPRFFLVARYDHLASHHLTEQVLKHATIHLGYALLANLRLAAESAVPLDRVEASRLSLRVDVAF
jgi:hypothetical protein